jgi:hypothetical protein
LLNISLNHIYNVRTFHSQVVVYLLVPSEVSLRFSEHRFFSGVGSSPPRPTPNL